MALFGRWRKPEWDHKDAAVRARAVRGSTDPALLGRLAEIAQRDPSAEVRRAAIARIDDPVLLARRMRGDNDPQVAAAARARLADRLCADEAAGDEHRAVLRDVIDVELLGRIAEAARDATLRRDALEKLDRPGLLVERCLADPDRSIRLWLLSRIESVDALQRIEREARRRDKTLTRAARERIDALQLAAGDPLALERRVRGLCERLEQLSRELPADRQARLEMLEAEWAALEPQVDPAMAARARAFVDLARTTIDAAARGPEPAPLAAPIAPAPVADERAEASVAADAAVGTAATSMAEPALDALLARMPSTDAADADAQLAALAGEAAALQARHPGNPTVAAQFARVEAAISERRVAREHERTTQRNAELAEWLDALDDAIGGGSLAAARAARERIGDAALPPSLRQRLARAEAGIDKLANWQRWSGNRVRDRLCDEVAALHGSGLHPDALANRIKELQAEWVRLDALEGSAAPASDSGLARRFRALCHRALAPARGYFEKRNELRRGRAEDIEALLTDAQASIDAVDTQALVALRRQVTATLRELDGVPPQRRGELGRALRERLAGIDRQLAVRREQAAIDKRRLLARLRKDIQADPAAGVDAARNAQADWKRLPRAERAVDDALWAELRALIDPLFEQARGVADDARKRQADAEQAAAAILDELRALAGADGERLLHADTAVEQLLARWRELSTPIDEPPARRSRDDDRRPSRPRRPAAHPREHEFSAAVDRVRSARIRLLAERELQSLDALCRGAGLLDRYLAEPDARDAIAAELATLPLGHDARQRLQQRQQSIDAGQAEPAEAGQAELLAVRAELAADLPSPEQAQPVRRKEQLRRLAAKMEQGAGLPKADEIHGLLLDFAGLSLQPTERQALQQRMLAAARAIAAAHAGKG